jgi:hypothetical protein
MSETPEQRRRRLRWLTLGELLAVIAVAISALGLWKTWTSDDRPTAVVVEQRRPIALTLRGKPENDGRSLVISPVEQSHALQSLTITLAKTASPLSIGSDGELSAEDVENALGKNADGGKGTHRVRARIQADYVEAGEIRHSSGNYTLAYRWQGGGLLSRKSLRLLSLTRA